MTGVLIRREKSGHKETYMKGRKPCDNGGRDVVIEPQAKGYQGSRATNRIRKRRGRILAYSLQREPDPADIFISGF